MSGDSENTLEKDNNTTVKVKLAELPEREKIELKVSSEDAAESRPESAALVAAEATQEPIIAATADVGDDLAIIPDVVPPSLATPSPIKEPLPPLPSVMIGVLTAFISIMAFLVIPSEHCSKLAVANPSWSLSTIIATIFFGLHMAWFHISQKQLIKHTVPLLPQAEQGAGSRTALLSLLPIAWITLIVYVFSEKLFFGIFPLLQALPWLMLVSFIYFATALNYWPKQLKKLCSPGQIKTFPNKFSAFLMTGFMTVPYIWYWKKALKAANHIEAPTAYKLQSKVIDRDKMVIRYRPFIAVERWFKHRHKSTSKKERYINASIALTINIVLLQLFCYFYPSIAADIVKLLTPGLVPPAGGAALTAGNIFTISNQTFLAIVGAITASLAVAATYFVVKQPTNYEFTPLGFKSFRWFGEKKIESDLVTWQSLTSIELNTKDKKGETSASELLFNLDNGNPVKLSMGAVESVEDREIILDAIERWAPGVSRSAALVQALQPPVDHSYTEMWLQALSAPPQRDRLKPLTEDIVLNDGRYRVKRSLGVGGQGAAYSAYDHASGDTVVLKEFLLPIYVDISIRKDVLESFESEARILKHLNHDQVVKLKDFFVEDHRAYLVLEHIDGQSLRQVVSQEGPLSEEKVRELTRQMCTILDYLHSQEPQVVHRDFTPENLILRKDGVLKLIDFNVARQVESNATGSVVGKPAYLPPEQFRGQPVSQSDIYGMGATLSFLLTGKEPEPISVSHPREENKKVSRSMDNIVAKATAINLKDRYANCSQIIEDLDAPISSNDDKDDDDNNDSNGHSTSAKAAEASSKKDDNENYELKKEAQKVSFVNPAPFKLKETTDDKITLKVSDSASLVSNGQLTISEEDRPEFANALINNHTETGSKNTVSGSMALSSQAKNNSRFGSISAIIASVGAFVSWLTITLAIAWLFIPGSPSWFDNKAALHQHGHAAMLAIFNNQTVKAIEECNQCIAIDPNCAVAYFGRAYSRNIDLQLQRKQDPEIYKTMLVDLKKAQQLEPNDYAILVAYGHVLSQTGNYAEAEAAFKKAQTADHTFLVPNLVEAIFIPRKVHETNICFEIAKAQLFQMRYQDAIKFYDTRTPDKYYAYGCHATDQVIAYELAHQPQQALSKSNDAEKYDISTTTASPSVVPLVVHREALQRAMLASKADSSLQPAMNLLYDGLALHGMANYDQAVEKLSQAIKLKADYADFYLIRGSCYRYLHKYDLALADFETALKLQPKNQYAEYMKEKIAENQKGKEVATPMDWTRPE